MRGLRQYTKAERPKAIIDALPDVLFIGTLGIMRASVNFGDNIMAVFRITVLCLAVLVAACGQTGPLVYPDKNDAPANSSAQSK
ncbi:hypothetical protein GCM10022414_13370 [Zhongshania borealis]|uniref:Lipoprotein n=1 Tax=Zhongshania borealis TaxID=889488 RepID=A0ABP7WLB1_9GAMM